MKTVFFSAAALAAVFGATAAQAGITYNSAPSDTWFYGDGNAYSPAHTAVLTTDAGNELYLRFHQTGVVAPASVGNLYSFALGTSPLSFDWGFDAGDEFSDLLNVTANWTLTNLGTGVSITKPHTFQGDNEFANGSVQNSHRVRADHWVGWGDPVGFDPNVDGSYRIQLDVFGLPGDVPQSLFVDAQLGAGAPAVPEPATWAMMLLGMGLVGATMRRKAKADVRVSYA